MQGRRLAVRALRLAEELRRLGEGGASVRGARDRPGRQRGRNSGALRLDDPGRDPHDAILGAANYLHANGAPRNYRRALFRYNASWRYVDAALRYAQLIRADRQAFCVLYSRQVFVRTPHGLVRLTGPR